MTKTSLSIKKEILAPTMTRMDVADMGLREVRWAQGDRLCMSGSSQEAPEESDPQTRQGGVHVSWGQSPVWEDDHILGMDGGDGHTTV